MKTPSALRLRSRPVPGWRGAVVALLVVALLVVAAIIVPAFFGSPAAMATPQPATREALAKLRDAWVQDLRTKQLEPILKFYAVDAAFLQPDGKRVTGSAAKVSRSTRWVSSPGSCGGRPARAASIIGWSRWVARG